FNLIPYIVLNVQELIDRLPALIDTFQQLLDKFQLDFELTNFFDYTNLIQNNENMISILKHLLSYLGLFISNFSSGFSTVFGMIILVPVILFYILSSFHEIRSKIKATLIKKQNKKLYVALKQCEDVLSAYISGTLFISFLLSIIATIFFSIIGIPNAIVFGIIIGLANIVPYVGQIIATVPPALFGLTVSPITPLIVVAGIMILNFIETNFFRPIIISKAINFHPVILLTLIILGGQIFGLLGMLVIIPVAGIVRVITLYIYDLVKTILVKSIR
ncbi:MAG TPA: AI-2E family transporter, partial [Firmicutes bacterium]|nr:AI-2E family transporter [Bacillota bacterium]